MKIYVLRHGETALNAKGVIDGPYPFFRVKKQSAFASVLWMTALFAVIAAISVAVGKLV